MAGTLTPEQRRLLEAPNFAHLATIMPDGTPQVTPVWVDYDGRYVLVNTALGRVKERNLRRDPRVGLDVADQQNPYKMVSIRGRVAELTTEHAEEHIDRLAKKYLGQDRYPYRQPNERRVIIKIDPQHVAGWG